MRDGIAIILVLSACSGTNGTADGQIAVDAPLVDGRPPLDAPPPDAPLASLTCRELSELGRPLVDALDRICDGDSDCEIVSPPSILPSCDRMHLFAGSDSAARKGWVNVELTALRNEFRARCERDESCSGDNPCVADWAPPSVSCTAHSCTSIHGNCFIQIDAGP